MAGVNKVIIFVFFLLKSQFSYSQAHVSNLWDGKIKIDTPFTTYSDTTNCIVMHNDFGLFVPVGANARIDSCILIHHREQTRVTNRVIVKRSGRELNINKVFAIKREDGLLIY